MLRPRQWKEIARSLGLSARETQIARAVFDDLVEDTIASRLGISRHTVHNHLRRMFGKLRVRTRVGLVLRVLEALFALAGCEAASGLKQIHAVRDPQPLGPAVAWFHLEPIGPVW